MAVIPIAIRQNNPKLAVVAVRLAAMTIPGITKICLTEWSRRSKLR
jgi:hypothetical protein